MDLAIEQVLTQVVAFLIMLWILKKFFWKPILGLLEKRKELIASEFDSIEEQKGEIKKLADHYHHQIKNIEMESKAEIQKAIEKGQKLAQTIEFETHEKAAAILHKARQDIVKEMQQARVQLKEEIVNLTVMATKKLIKETLNEEQHKKIIKASIEQIDLK
jgi:F-type H+-transporting ATPase subunit b